MRAKDLWFREFERLLNEGAPYSDETANRAREAQRDLLADRADAAKDRAKESRS